MLTGSHFDSNASSDLPYTFKLLLYSLILKFCYNIINLIINKQYYEIDLDSKVWKITHVKNIFNSLDHLEDITYTDGSN